MAKKKNKPERFFFNHKGIKGHASFAGKPDKKTLEAFFKMVELAHKNVKKYKDGSGYDFSKYQTKKDN